MDECEKFHRQCLDEIHAQGENSEIHDISRQWIGHPAILRYSYHFTWLGRPIIQYPQDIVAMQELVWQVKPDLIIETGIAHGGSLIFYASMLELSALCGGPKNSLAMGIDIEIRSHNRRAIEAHPIYKLGRIRMLEGSSTDQSIIRQVREIAGSFGKIMVILDSSHTHAHVLAELEAYAPLVSSGSYCVVCDTVIEQMPDEAYPERPWGKGNNAATAVAAFLEANPDFRNDRDIEDKLLITVSPGGFLKKVS